ncbi:Protein ASPARTIC PROTEASE IN GUARD CELL 2 [Dendrobium catenatum]|uniref:Protein ASPARTIC PROTEASE IN GUARD CELL 2 n=1 Tax=Dendrobium catenatum TaxID=906689 RepID=A0A2I0W2W7_9ASPA|nr:Protein ASPARTIC PROTEASE IN GUARD CELL 2 [Dendrobium catenatum]
MSPYKLKVIHQNGQCSSQARQDNTSHVELLRWDQARVDYIHRRAAKATAILNASGGSLFAGVPVNIGIALNTDHYIIKIGLGTPTTSFSFVFDTGSDLTWTQCLPCINCYDQKDPFYDPTQSSSFDNIPCNSEYCVKLSTCLYHEEYEDDSYTNGSFIQDNLKFSSNIIQNFSFGCGHNNSGEFGQVDGLLGLGRGDLSIISQTAQLYNKVFSYCLPSSVNYTPMLSNPNLPSWYFLKLIAISIGGTRLPLSSTVFTGPGTMLDSGTVITHLPPTAYFALRNIFQQYMKRYPTAPPLNNLDTCYNLTNYEKVSVPSIVLIFDQVTVNLDFMGIVYIASNSQVCLAFAANYDDDEIVVIGNTQQRRYIIVYDLRKSKIGFRANGCS